MEISSSACFWQHGRKEIFILSARLRVSVVAMSGLLVACSLVLGVIGKAYFTFGPIRITFENLPVLLGGFLFGPLLGGMVGVCSDLLSCVAAGNPINPIITLGAFAVGFLAGFFKKKVCRSDSFFSFFLSALFAHVIGSMVIKSVGLRVYYVYPYHLLFLRIPLYFFIGGIEGYALYAFSKIKFVRKLLGRV